MDIRYATDSDVEIYVSLDGQISTERLREKFRDNQCYLAVENGIAAGCLRYGYFWDSIPFCNHLYIAAEYGRRGYGTALIKRWESDMKTNGFDHVMLSTRADENAQHFYRKLGYRDCGALFLRSPPLSQPTELFFIKKL